MYSIIQKSMLGSRQLYKLYACMHDRYNSVGLRETVRACHVTPGTPAGMMGQQL